MKEITRPSVAHVIQLESFDYEEQMQQTAAFEAAAMVALSNSVSVRPVLFLHTVPIRMSRLLQLALVGLALIRHMLIALHGILL